MVTRILRVVYTERPTGVETDAVRTIDEGMIYATGRESGTDHRRCRGCRRTTHGLWWGGSTALRPRRRQGGVDRYQGGDGLQDRRADPRQWRGGLVCAARCHQRRGMAR